MVGAKLRVGSGQGHPALTRYTLNQAPLPVLKPMILARLPEPFSDPDCHEGIIVTSVWS